MRKHGAQQFWLSTDAEQLKIAVSSFHCLPCTIAANQKYNPYFTMHNSKNTWRYPGLPSDSVQDSNKALAGMEKVAQPIALSVKRRYAKSLNL